MSARIIPSPLVSPTTEQKEFIPKEIEAISVPQSVETNEIEITNHVEEQESTPLIENQTIENVEVKN